MRRKRIAIIVGIAVAPLVILFLAVDTGRTSRELARCRHLSKRGKQGWGDEVSHIVSNMISRSSNKHRLAERLLSQDDGSLVSEGLVLVVQENHPEGQLLISKHLNDQRWNYNLEDNSTTASNCLLTYVSQNKQEKTKEDLRNIAMWRYYYVTHDLSELEEPGSTTSPCSVHAGAARR